MPELPEVETVRRHLEPILVGSRIVRAEIADPRLTRPHDPEVVALELRGERVAALGRRGKHLLFRFESERTLVVHLRMTGSFAYGCVLADDLHRRATLLLDSGVKLAYRDVRRFGTWLLLEPGRERPYLASRLGPEPLGRSFTAARLGEILRGRRAPVKAVLLDQRRIAGVGNIYADEALWRAGIAPRRVAGGLESAEIAGLHRAIRHVLRTGIERQGASLSDYVTPGGEPGEMQEEFQVYGRGDEPCPRCGSPIERSVVAGRGTWTCPGCQR